MGGPSPARAAGCGCLGFIGSRGYNAALVSGCADAQAVAPLVGTGLESLKTHSDEVAGQTGRSRFLGAHGRGGFRGLHDQRGTRTLEHQNGVTGPDCRAGWRLPSGPSTHSRSSDTPTRKGVAVPVACSQVRLIWNLFDIIPPCRVSLPSQEQAGDL